MLEAKAFLQGFSTGSAGDFRGTKRVQQEMFCWTLFLAFYL